ncbi:MAG: hypothetical protein WC331_10215 [Candidatus Omnitrophota bacterium]|jgi:hypothetical protein
MARLILSKRDVAEKQLDTAVRLFFQDEDPVSTHTLAAAAHDILEVLTRGVRDFDILSEVSLIKPEKKKEVIKIFKKAQNFFKHASRDVSKTIKFAPFHTEAILFDCVRMYIHLTKQKTPEVHAYHMWFIMRYPQYFNYLYDPNNPLFKMFVSVRRSGLNPKNLKGFHDVLTLLRRSGKFPMPCP